MNAEKFKKLVWGFYAQNGRRFPWRQTRDPYRILVSEIMLQQTQVARVVPKYLAFIKEFPNCAALAQAGPADVLRLWSGLGYNRRALYLHRAAQTVVSKYRAKMPSGQSDLLNLPGVGAYTAAAVMAFAYNKPSVFLETNIRRVYLHHFFKGRRLVADKELLPFIKKTLDTRRPRQWYWALMDYGAHLAAAVENPNRRSRHYVRQSKFQGSPRQLRGQVVKLLLQRSGVTLRVLKKMLPDPRLPDILQLLHKEGFVAYTGTSVHLKNSNQPFIKSKMVAANKKKTSRCRS